MRFSFLLILGLFASIPAATGQVVLFGSVSDARTGERLPSATVQVEGTYTGTITNADGTYQIRMPELPATLVVRYIGYETIRRRVDAASPAEQSFSLTPVSLELAEVVISGEDPAIGIMRKVIERKKQWRRGLNTFEAEAYSRFTLANDTGIVSIVESLSSVFWDREKGFREIIRSQRQTTNFPVDTYLPWAQSVANLYDDDVVLAGFTLVGVTHEKALSIYDFRLVDRRRLDGTTVFDIEVRPRSRLASGFEGRIAVLDSAFAMIEAVLKPGPSFVFPPPFRGVQVEYTQQFSDFGRDVFLPVDFQSTMALEVGMGNLLTLPAIRIRHLARFTDYRINTDLPDSLYREEQSYAVDSASVRRDTLLDDEGVVIPLDPVEKVAYASIDSTLTFDKAYKPGGLLGRYVQVRARANDREVGTGSKSFPLRVIPGFRYNRVEGLNGHLTLKGRIKSVELGLTGGYSPLLEGSNRLERGVEATWDMPGKRFLSGKYAYATAPVVPGSQYADEFTGLYMLFGGDDYHDYYVSERASLTFSQQLRRVGVEIGGFFERPHSVARSTSYDLVGRTRPQRFNPSINQPDIRGVTVAVFAGNAAEGAVFLAPAFFRLDAEVGRVDVSGNPDYLRLQLRAGYRIPTFFRRRLLPNVLDVWLSGGWTNGYLNETRLHVIDGSLGPLKAPGALRTMIGHPLVGNRSAGLFWEHNFRTVPFEALGLYGLARRGYSLQLHGGHAWNHFPHRLGQAGVPDLSTVANGSVHEVGVSLSGLFGYLRLDATKRLDAPGYALGIGLARIF